MLTNIYSGNKTIAITFYSLLFFIIFDYIFSFTVFKSQLIVYFFLIFNMLSFIYCVCRYGFESNIYARYWLPYLGLHIISLALNGNISTIPYWVVSLLLLYMPEKILGVFKPTVFIYIGLFFSVGVFLQYLFPSLYISFIYPLFIADASEFIEDSLYYEVGFSGFSPQSGTTAYLLLVCQCFLLACKEEKGVFSKKKVRLGLLAIFILAIFLTGKRMPSAISLGLLVVFFYFSNLGNVVRNFFILLFLFLGCFLLLQYFIENINQYADNVFLKRFVSSFDSVSAGGDITSGRTELYNKALLLFSQEPVLGIGANNYPTISGMGMQVHNTYLQVLCEEGILRFPLFIMPLLFTVLLTLKKLFSRSNCNGKNILLLSLMLQLVFILYSFTGNTIVNISNYIFYFMSVGFFIYASNRKLKN